DYSMRQSERDARDCGRCVVADAGQGADAGVVGGESPGCDCVLRGAPQIAGARVVAQAAPQREDVVLGGGLQIGDRRESRLESLVVRNQRLGAGVLQHDFGDPDPIGVGGAAPGKIAVPAAVPRGQRAPDVYSITRSHSATTAKSCGSTSQAW